MAEAEIPPPGVVIVEDRNIGPFAETVRVGNHVLSADEPASSGPGDDKTLDTGASNVFPNPPRASLTGPRHADRRQARVRARRRRRPSLEYCQANDA